MSLPTYGEYKDSGVASLGAIPVHWECSPLKRVVSLVESGVSVNAVDEPASSGAFGVLKTSCVYSGNFVPAENKAVVAEELDRVACHVKAGTLIVSRMNTPALVGAAGLALEDIGNLFLPDRLWQVHFSGASPQFVHYWTATPSYRAQVQMACAGTSASMQNLSQEEFLRFMLPLPAHDEQTAIAAFIDRETAKIDALLAEQEKLIALLAEKRQATISYAVTKGLDPDAPMKGSSVVWLGEVPAHWDVVPLKWLLDNVKAGPFGSALTKDIYVSSGYRVYGQEQVIPADFSRGDYYISDETYGELQQYAVKPGDILISCVGTFGKIAIVPQGVEPGIINPRLIRLRAGALLDSEFLTVVLRSSIVFEQFAMVSRGGTMDTINIGTLNAITLALPPLHEQSEILAFLAKEVAKLDVLSSAADQAITLLKERRSALIAAAVTGKIDVRSAILQDAAERPEAIAA